MTAADWDVVYRDGVPVEMQWNPRDRPSARCPRTYPHEPHAPWFGGNVRGHRLGDYGATGFDCPGVPLSTVMTEGET